MFIDESFLWSNSTCVLSYIANRDKRFETFIANRIAAIHEGSRASHWRYVDTGSNPADDASRGLSAEELVAANGGFAARLSVEGRIVLA